MSVTTFLAVLGGLLALAFVANRLFHLTRIPDVIVLLAVGLLLGPIFGWVQPAAFRTFTDALGTLALILILFEGGLDLNLRDTIRHFPGGVLLAFLGYGLSVGLVALGSLEEPRLPLGSCLARGRSARLHEQFDCPSSPPAVADPRSPARDSADRFLS